MTSCDRTIEGGGITTHGDRSQDTAKLLKLATTAGQLSYQLSRETETYRIAGKLARLAGVRTTGRFKQMAAALAEAHVDLATGGVDPLAGDPRGFFLLQCALAQVSFRMWEELWNEKHTELLGKVWEGEDFELMSVWRERVRTMMMGCRQGKVLTMNSEEYVGALIESGATEQAAMDLVDWLSEVEYGATGST
jgi:hypothetical protein